jgi:hypothetical protein
MNTRNRGSDDNVIKTISNNLTFGFHRRSIVDTNFKGKPLYYPNKPYVVVYNGELRNCKALIEEHILDTHSNNDCEVILCLYEKYGIAKTIELIDSGAFAFCIYDGIENKLIVTRDRFGVRPLFVSNRVNGELVIASEAKSIVNIFDDDDSIKQFPPGTWSSYDVNTFKHIETYRYCDFKRTTTNVTDAAEIYRNINEFLTKTASKLLISGGVGIGVGGNGTNKQLSLINFALGFISTLLGIALFFERNFIRIGNIFLIASIILFMGPMNALSFFMQPKRLRPSACLAVGILLVFYGRPIIGLACELFGVLNLLGNLFPLLGMVVRMVPVIVEILGGMGGKKTM